MLGAFTAHEPRLNLKDVASRAGLDAATALRILNTLTDAAMIERLDSGKYCLGLHTLELAQICTARFDVQQIAIPHMHHVSAELDETVFISVRSADHRVAIAQVEGTQEYRRSGGLGSPVMLHHGAPSRVLLAFQSDNFIADYISRHADAIGSESELREAVADIRRRGFAITENERGNGGAGVAFPLRGYGGEILASFAAAVPISRWPDVKDRATRILEEATDQINAELGYRSSK